MDVSESQQLHVSDNTTTVIPASSVDVDEGEEHTSSEVHLDDDMQSELPLDGDDTYPIESTPIHSDIQSQNTTSSRSTSRSTTKNAKVSTESTLKKEIQQFVIIVAEDVVSRTGGTLTKPKDKKDWSDPKVMNAPNCFYKKLFDKYNHFARGWTTNKVELELDEKHDLLEFQKIANKYRISSARDTDELKRILQSGMNCPNDARLLLGRATAPGTHKLDVASDGTVKTTFLPGGLYSAMKTYYITILKRILPDFKVPSGKSIEDYYKCVRYYYCLLVEAHSRNEKFELYHMENSELKEYLEYYIDNPEENFDTSFYPDHFRAFVALGPTPEPHTFTLRDCGGKNLPTESRDSLKESQKQESKKNKEGASHTLVTQIIDLTEERQKNKEIIHIENSLNMYYRLHNLSSEIEAYRKVFGDNEPEINKIKADFITNREELMNRLQRLKDEREQDAD